MFFETLESACLAKNRTVNDVVKCVGGKASTITYWRQGNLPSLRTVYALAAELGVSAAELVPDEPSEKVS